MAEFINEIRGVMIPVTGANVVLPNAAIAEVVSHSPPGRMPCEQNWILGFINWRGWQVPMFSFSIMAGLAEEEKDVTARVAVLKALTGSTNMPFFAMLTQGFPQLYNLNKQNLQVVPGAEMTPGVAFQVNVEGQTGYIPDLPYIEKALSQCLAENRKTA